MVTVYNVDQKFSIDIKTDNEEVVRFIVQPLRYRQKAKINSQSVSFDKGETFIDQGLSTFLTLKYSIKDIEGLVDSEGNKFKLEFESEGDDAILTDDCLESLLNSELGFVLNFYAKDAIVSTPHKIKNPVTLKPLDYVEFRPFKSDKVNPDGVDSKKKL